MSKWHPKAPYANLVFAPDPSRPDPHGRLSRFTDAMVARPGVKLKDGHWRVPLNAVDVVDFLANHFGMRTVVAAWGLKPTPPLPWTAIQQVLLASGEIRPEYVTDFPRPHQIEAIQLAWNARGFHLWHSTGAGKTFTGIVSAVGTPGPVLIVTRSAARFQLAREVERFTNSRAYVLRAEGQERKITTVNGQTWRVFFASQMAALGSATAVGEAWERMKAQYGEVTTFVDGTLEDYLRDRKTQGLRPWVLVGWESLLDHLDRIRELAPAVLLLDEMHLGKSNKRWDRILLAELPPDPIEARAQAVKDHQDARAGGGYIREEPSFPGGPMQRIMYMPVVNRAAAAGALSRSVSVQKRIALTATPVENRVRDLWGQLDTIEPNCWGNKTLFDEHHCDARPGRFGGVDNTGQSHVPELNTRLQRVTHKVPAHIAQAHLLHLKRRQSVYVAREDQDKPLGGLANLIKRAKKDGAGTSRLELELQLAASKKRKAVIGLVDDHVGSDHKIVIFTARKRDCEDIGQRILKARMGKVKKPKVWIAHGGTDSETRDQIVREYMESDGPCILVGTGQAFGESLNLDDTDAAFFVMLPYTPGALRQWEGRFVRLSMTRAVVIYYVIAEGTVDEHIASILIDKLPAVEELSDDQELGAASSVLAGFDPNETDDEFAQSILSDLDW